MAPTPGQHKARKRDPLLEEQARDEVPGPAKGLGRNRFQPMAATLGGDRDDDAANADD